MERFIAFVRALRIALTGNLFERCQHHYEIHKEVGVYEDTSDSMPIYRKYILRCKHCGKMKNFKA